MEEREEERREDVRSRIETRKRGRMYGETRETLKRVAGDLRSKISSKNRNTRQEDDDLPDLTVEIDAELDDDSDW